MMVMQKLQLTLLYIFHHMFILRLIDSSTKIWEIQMSVTCFCQYMFSLCLKAPEFGT